MSKSKKSLPISMFGSMLDEAVKQLGGYINAHAHIDRSGTLDHKYLQHYGLTPLEATSASLPQKQNLTGELHKSPAYNPKDLSRRMASVIQESIHCGVKELVTFIDTTPDVGSVAIDQAILLKEAWDLKIRLAAHPIFGFKKPERWDLFEETCRRKEVDIIGGLPEKDDHPNSIGFREHLQKIINLGIELNKEVHIHVDQSNLPTEHGTWRTLKALYGLGCPEIKGHNGPTVWLVHVISPSSYDEQEFSALLEEMLKMKVGVICCPRAALSMRQYRHAYSPIHNSLARILEMAYVGIPIKIGTDNIADMFVPTGSASMLNEILILADILRFYNIQVLAKLASGQKLNETDREIIGRHLIEDAKATRFYNPNFRSCIE